MAGLLGNAGWLLGARQTAKGSFVTPSATNSFKTAFSGGNVSPVRAIDRLAETDSSRDRGVAYVQTSGVEGSPQIYVRDASIGFWLYAALGADAVAGTTNFTHTITPSNSLPYVTAWKDLADTLYERYEDCKVSSIEVQAEAGSPLQATVGLQGRNTTRLTAAPDNAAPIAIESSTVYNFNNATVTLSGGATAIVRSFDLTIENNVSRQQTDDVIPYDVVEGSREVSLGFDLIFEDLREYNSFHYGTTTGTAISSTIYTTSATFLFSLGTNNNIQFTIPSLAYEEFPVDPDPGGDPIVASVRAVAQRGASPVVTAVVRNQVATY